MHLASRPRIVSNTCSILGHTQAMIQRIDAPYRSEMLGTGASGPLDQLPSLASLQTKDSVAAREHIAACSAQGRDELFLSRILCFPYALLMAKVRRSW